MNGEDTAPFATKNSCIIMVFADSGYEKSCIADFRKYLQTPKRTSQCSMTGSPFYSPVVLSPAPRLKLEVRSSHILITGTNVLVILGF